MREEFNNLYNQINTPDEWKNDIKAKMKAALLEEQKSNVVTFNDRPNRNTTIVNKKSKSKMPIAISFATVAVAAGLLIGIIVFGNSKVSTLRPKSSVETTDTSDYADVHVIDSSEAMLGGTTDSGMTGSVTKYSVEGIDIYISNISEDHIPIVADDSISYIGDREVIIIESNEDNQKSYSAYVKGDNIKIFGNCIDQTKFLEVVSDYLSNK